MITELRYASACLANIDAGTPNLAALQRSSREIRTAADQAFDEWLNSLPKDLSFDVEDQVAKLTLAWQDDAYERGFRAGIRLMCQAMGGGFDEDNRRPQSALDDYTDPVHSGAVLPGVRPPAALV